jgi:hypothetical protein
VPVGMGRRWRDKAVALGARGGARALQPPGRLQDPVDTAGAHRHNVGIQHPVRQMPVTIQGVGLGEGQDRRALPGQQPEVTRLAPTDPARRGTCPA